MVMPDNTQAIMHWSGLFERRRRERAAQKAQAAKMDEQRRADLAKYIGNKLNKPEFYDTYDYKTYMDNNIGKLYSNAIALQEKGLPIDQIYASINEEWGGIYSDALKIKGLYDNTKAGVAALMKKDSYVDGEALAELATYMSTHDEKGNLRPLSEVDLNKSWVDEAYRAHPDKVFDSAAMKRAEEDYFKRLPTSDVNDQPTYDKNYDVVRRGYVGKLPGIASPKLDPQTGLPLLRANGAPEIEINRSENYRMPGETTDATDTQGNPIRVMEKEAFDMLYNGPMVKRVDMMVNEQLKSAGIENPDEDMVDMLKRKSLYDWLKRGTEENYQFKIPDNKSLQLKRDAFNRDMQLARLRLQRERNNIAKKRQEDIDNTVTPVMNELADRFGKEPLKTMHLEMGDNVRVIDIADIDNDRYEMITGDKEKPSAKASGESDSGTTAGTLLGTTTGAKKPKTTIEPIRQDGRAYFIIDENGDWYGQEPGSGGKVSGRLKAIDYNAAYDRQLKYENPIQKTKTPVRNAGGAKNVFQKAVSGAKEFFLGKGSLDEL